MAREKPICAEDIVLSDEDEVPKTSSVQLDTSLLLKTFSESKDWEIGIRPTEINELVITTAYEFSVIKTYRNLLRQAHKMHEVTTATALRGSLVKEGKKKKSLISYMRKKAEQK